jgi:hypothetical protein
MNGWFTANEKLGSIKGLKGEEPWWREMQGS